MVCCFSISYVAYTATSQKAEAAIASILVSKALAHELNFIVFIFFYLSEYGSNMI